MLQQRLKRFPTNSLNGAQPLAAALVTVLIIVAGTWVLAALIANLLHTPMPPPVSLSRPASPPASQIADQLLNHLHADPSPQPTATRPPSMHLTATLGASDPAEARAILIVDGTDKPLVARVGDRISETWLVSAITARVLHLTNAERRTSITLTLPGSRRQDTPTTTDAKERD